MCLETGGWPGAEDGPTAVVVVHECVSRVDAARRYVRRNLRRAAASLDGEGGEGKSGEVMGHVSFSLMVWLFGRRTQANRQELQ